MKWASRRGLPGIYGGVVSGSGAGFVGYELSLFIQYMPLALQKAVSDAYFANLRAGGNHYNLSYPYKMF